MKSDNDLISASLTACTKILRCAQDDSERREGKCVMRLLPHISGDLMPLSSVACGATSFLRKEAEYCGGAATSTLSPGRGCQTQEPSGRRAGQT